MTKIYFSPWETLPLPPDLSENERRGIDLNENGGVDAGFEAWRTYLWLVEGGAAERHAGPEMEILRRNLLGVFPAEQRVELYGYSLRWEGKPLDFFPLFMIREALRVFSPAVVEKWAHGSLHEKPLRLTDAVSLNHAAATYDDQNNVLTLHQKLFNVEPEEVSWVITHELWHAWSDFSVQGDSLKPAVLLCFLPVIWTRREESNEGAEELVTRFFIERIFPYLWSDADALEEEIREARECLRSKESDCLLPASIETATQKLQLEDYYGFWFYHLEEEEWQVPSEIFAHLAAPQTAPLWRRLTRAEGLWIGSGRPSLPVLRPLQDWLKILLEENRVENRIAKM